ncbi:MAG: type II DNA modification enzyme, partial [Anaerolineae bacterium]|nr:type II DNA modification enzyme [Anaerolineae bacterium]
DAELTAKLYRAAPVLVNETTGENPWGVSFSTMFHMTNDSHLFCTREELVARGAKLHGNVFVGNGDEYLPLYEAKMFWHIDHRFGSYEGNDSRSDVHLTIPTPDQYRSPEYQVRPWYWVRRMDVVERSPSDLSWFLAFRDITNTTNERTGVFTLLPWSGLSNKAPVLIPRVDFPNIISGFLANLDALVFDFCIRQKMGGTSLNFYIVKQLPVLPPETYSSDLLRFIIPRVLELTYTAWDLRAFADDVWAEAGAGLREAVTAQWEANAAATGGGHRDAVAPDWAPAPGPDPFPCPPFMWDEARRALLRAELDGLYAHLYGLTREELAYILDTFPIVRRKDEARYGEFRTKRLVLAAYEEVKSDP